MPEAALSHESSATVCTYRSDFPCSKELFNDGPVVAVDITSQNLTPSKLHEELSISA